jgi:hypothetical protein
MDPVVALETNGLRKQISFWCCVATGARMGMLLTGCGVNITPQLGPAVPSQI